MSRILHATPTFDEPFDTAHLLKYMRSVTENKEKLSDLSKNWDTLSLLSKLGHAGVNMDAIKHNFTTLSEELITHLAQETLKKTVAQMQSKAQVAVDIVIRNLFERTADIGFLATDEDIRAFLRANKTPFGDAYAQKAQTLRRRFASYVSNYSVYFDIVLLNPQGDIMVSLDETQKLNKSHDAVIHEALHTNKEYVETYKYHDFLPHYPKTLVYSYKVTQSNDPSSEPIGVLCLCFRFTDEMKSIFKNLVHASNKECLMLLDQSGSVIATSDAYHIPIGAPLETVTNAPFKIVTFGGRDYLAKSCLTNGYQGFYGLGWFGHIMVPLEHAFECTDEEGFEMSQALLLAILQHGSQFKPALKNIPLQASSIQYNLNRAIWNGNIKQSNTQRSDNKQFSRSLLLEIRKTGENTKKIIGSSIANLTKTMVLSDTRFLSHLVVDIMDRNLYERANDCRWWALTSDFRQILSQTEITAAHKEHMHHILGYINDLYTVYTLLFIYDTQGKIIAVSKPTHDHLIGRTLHAPWADQTLKNSNPKNYFVSPFEETFLYQEQPTYIFNASIRSMENETRVVGGIGIVFDSSVQFQNMIEELLPKQQDHTIKPGVFVVLATKERRIIASNDTSHGVGATLSLPFKYFELAEGESMSEIITYDGKYYALGVACSQGYREFKSAHDAYSNPVYAFYFSYISDVQQTVIAHDIPYALEKELSLEAMEDSIDVATFYIGTKWLGIDTKSVVECISISQMDDAILIETDHHFKGTILYDDKAVAIIDIQNFIKEGVHAPYSEIIIVKYGTQKEYIGILVNALGEIPEIATHRIKELNEYVIGSKTLIKSLVFPLENERNKEILTLLNIQKLNRALVEPELAHF